MNIMPLVGFYWKHGSQIEAMVSKNKGGGNGTHTILDLAHALVPFVKKTWPQYNANGLLDDALSTLDAALAAPAPVVGVPNLER